MGETFNNYYELLRVSQNAPTEVIHAAYRTLMSKMKKHPDLGGDEAEAVLLNQAYEVLKNPEARARYDAAVLAGSAESKPHKKGEERRRSPRFAVDATVSFCLDQDNRWYAARAKDLSKIGVRLMTCEPIGKGQSVVLACPNPAAHAIRGKIRWSRMYHPNVFERIYEAGIEFATIIDDIEARFKF